MNSPNPQHSPNPLANMDPISQYQDMKHNIQELNKNFNSIIGMVKPVVKGGLKQSCQISKKMAETICSLSDSASEGMDNITQFTDLEKMSKKLQANYNKFKANPIQQAQLLAQHSLDKTQKLSRQVAQGTNQLAKNLPSTMADPSAPPLSQLQQTGSVTDNLLNKRGGRRLIKKRRAKTKTSNYKI